MNRIALLSIVALTACASSRAPSQSSNPPEVRYADYGRRLVGEAASCWLGGLGSDAAGEQGDARQQGIDERCSTVLSEIGEAPHETYASLRAVDDGIVQRLEAQLETRGAKDLVPLLRAVADASREELRARRVADRVKSDYALDIDPDTRRMDKDVSASTLGESHALGALLRYDGAAKEDARAVGLLLALDRLEIARGLPKHLKVIATSGALKDVFGVDPPSLGGSPATPIPTGTWRDYLERVAAACGHPVPADTQDVFDRETYAWTGVLAGFADRLGKTKPQAELAVIVATVDDRLALERAGAMNASPTRKAKR